MWNIQNTVIYCTLEYTVCNSLMNVWLVCEIIIGIDFPADEARKSFTILHFLAQFLSVFIAEEKKQTDRDREQCHDATSPIRTLKLVWIRMLR